MKKGILTSLGLAAVLTLGLASVNEYRDFKEVDAAEGTWTLVTDASTLKAEDKVVIAAKGANYAMGADKGNNRAAVAITKSNGTLTLESGVQELTLKTGKVSGSFGFYTGSGYLYTSSGSKNYLKTKTTLDAHGSWTITTKSSGEASIIATESTNRNVMQYNPNNGSPLFASYASASQTALELYKYIEVSGGTTDPDPEVPSEPEVEPIPTDPVEMTIAEALTKQDEYPIIVTGTVTNIGTAYSEQYDNISLTITDDEGKSIYAYRLNGNYEVGDVLQITGKMGTYNGSRQIAQGANAVKLNTNSSEAITNLVSKYVGTKAYVKDTVINLDVNSEDLKEDLAKNSHEFGNLFHAEFADLERTTHYYGNALWMTNETGTNSGYGTVLPTNKAKIEADLGYAVNVGDMTHFKYVNGTQDYDYIVKMANAGGMEEYYTTPYDFLADGYFANWENSGGIYTYTPSGKSSEDKVCIDFVNVVAPLLLNVAYTNYITITGLTVEEVENKLVLKILATGDTGKLVNGTTVLAQATITAGCTAKEVTSIYELEDGTYNIAATKADGTAKTYLGAVPSGKTYFDSVTEDLALEVEFEYVESQSAWTLCVDGQYIGYENNDSNSARLQEDAYYWTISYDFSTDRFMVVSKETPARVLQYNSSSPRFACYKASQQNLIIE